MHAEPQNVDPSAQRRLAAMIGGYCLSQAVYVAAKLGIAERLHRDGPQDAGQLARAVGAHASSLHRLMRTLASLGILTQDDAGRFALTELGHLLRPDAANSLWAMAMTVGETHYPAFAELHRCVKSGECGFDAAFGVSFFEHFKYNEQAAQYFDRAMAQTRAQATADVLDTCDFSEVRTVVDVGGGTGDLLTKVLAKYPAMRGVLFDLPHVVEKARERLDQDKRHDRLTMLGGDFFCGVPPHRDLYVLRHILHDWDDDRSLRILTNCRRAMKPGTRLLLVESIVHPGNEPSPAKVLDLVMLAMTGGMERTESQYRELLSAAGFTITQIKPAGEFHLIEAQPAELRHKSDGSEHERYQQQPAAAAAD